MLLIYLYLLLKSDIVLLLNLYHCYHCYFQTFGLFEIIYIQYVINVTYFFYKILYKYIFLYRILLIFY